jgi:putative membrane protein
MAGAQPEEVTAMETVLITLAHGGQAWGGPGPWWPLFPLLWFGLLIGAFAFFGSRFRRGWRDRAPRASAESVLAERYARGEISVQEYRERLGVLKESSQ